MEELTCPVCREEYDEGSSVPVVLPLCGHTYCRACLAAVQSRTGLECPTCRKKHPLHTVQELPTNYIALSLADSSKKRKLDATGTPLRRSSGGNSSSGGCPKHHNKQEYYCKECRLPLCGQCLFESHMNTGHEVVQSCDVLDEKKSELKTLSNSINNDIEEQGVLQLEAFRASVCSIVQVCEDSAKLHKMGQTINNIMKNTDKHTELEDIQKNSEAIKSLQDSLEKIKISSPSVLHDPGISVQCEADDLGSRDVDERLFLSQKQQVSKGDNSRAESPWRTAIPEPPQISSQNIAQTSESEVFETDCVINPDAAQKGPCTVSSEVSKRKHQDPPDTTIKQEISEIQEDIIVDHSEPGNETLHRGGRGQEVGRTSHRLENEFLPQPSCSRNSNHHEKQSTRFNRSTGYRRRSSPSDPHLSNFRLQDMQLGASASNSSPSWLDLNDAGPSRNRELLSHVLRPPPPPSPPDFPPLSPSDDSEIDVLEGDSRSSSYILRKYLQSQRKRSLQATDVENDGESVVVLSHIARPGSSQRNIPITIPAGLGRFQSSTTKPWPLKCCVYSTEGRRAKLQIENGSLIMYGLRESYELGDRKNHDAHVMIQMSVMDSIIPEDSPEVFLDIAIRGKIIGRVVIKLWPNLNRAKNFLALCTGIYGSSFRGSTSAGVSRKGKPGECFGVDEYLSRDGCGSARGLIDNLEWDGVYSRIKTGGLIAGYMPGQDQGSSFDIVTKSDTRRMLACPFGEVVSGLNFVQDAVGHEPVAEVTIKDLGVIIKNI